MASKAEKSAQTRAALPDLSEARDAGPGARLPALIASAPSAPARAERLDATPEDASERFAFALWNAGRKEEAIAFLRQQAHYRADALPLDGAPPRQPGAEASATEQPDPSPPPIPGPGRRFRSPPTSPCRRATPRCTTCPRRLCRAARSFSAPRCWRSASSSCGPASTASPRCPAGSASPPPRSTWRRRPTRRRPPAPPRRSSPPPTRRRPRTPQTPHPPTPSPRSASSKRRPPARRRPSPISPPPTRCRARLRQPPRRSRSRASRNDGGAACRHRHPAAAGRRGGRRRAGIAHPRGQRSRLRRRRDPARRRPRRFRRPGDAAKPRRGGGDRHAPAAPAAGAVA